MPDLHLMWVELFRSECLRKFLVTLTISHIAFEMRQRTSQIKSSWRLFVQSLGLLSTAAAAEEGEGDSKRNYYSEIEMCQVIVDDDDLGKQIDKLQ